MKGRDVPRVRYTEQPDGTVDITVTNAEATSLSIDSFPDHIRKEAQGTFHSTLTPSEQHKLRAAQDIGEPVYTAVWDDLVSARADELLRNLHATPVTMENGRDAITSPHYPSYLSDRDRF